MQTQAYDARRQGRDDELLKHAVFPLRNANRSLALLTCKVTNHFAVHESGRLPMACYFAFGAGYPLCDQVFEAFFAVMGAQRAQAFSAAVCAYYELIRMWRECIVRFRYKTVRNRHKHIVRFWHIDGAVLHFSMQQKRESVYA